MIKYKNLKINNYKIKNIKYYGSKLKLKNGDRILEKAQERLLSIIKFIYMEVSAENYIII